MSDYIWTWMKGQILKDSSIINTKIVAEYTLYENYPNPFNQSTVISYYLPVESNILVIIYNSPGQTVK